MNDTRKSGGLIREVVTESDFKRVLSDQARFNISQARKLPEETRQKIIKLSKDGLVLREIAAQVGCSVAIACRVRKEAGVLTKRRMERRDTILKLAADGLTSKEIAAKDRDWETNRL